MTDHAIENEIQAKGLTAPRITPADIEANIASEHYFTAADGVFHDDAIQVYHDESAFDGDPSLRLLTFCVLVLRNGFTVTGESACASPENFDAELGRKIARKNAIGKVWTLLGYELKERLHRSQERSQDVGACNDVITGTDALFIANAYNESLESPKQPNEKLRQAKAEYDKTIGKVVFTGDDGFEGEPVDVSGDTEPPFDDEDIAQLAELCHEVNKAYCESQGDTSQLPWAEAPDWQKDSAINGVKFHTENPDAGPRQSHESWLKQKQEEGWKWGPVKDVEKKEHPCFCDYDELPASQKAKDYIFTAIVKTITAIHLR